MERLERLRRHVQALKERVDELQETVLAAWDTDDPAVLSEAIDTLGQQDSEVSAAQHKVSGVIEEILAHGL